MKSRIFISSVQREFAKERKALASYIRQDAILGKFFEVFLFEKIPAQERKADGVYLSEVDECDIYLGIFGRAYGNVDSSGVSATEREYLRAAKKHKPRICRDYSSAASVQVMLFKDRLEIWSPGPLPKGMTLAKMYKRHKSYPANPLLAYAIFLRKYVEQTGTGTGDIIARCREWGLPDPKWQVEDGEDFVMVMPRLQSSVKSPVRSPVKTVDWTVNKAVDGSTNERILNLLATNPRATQEELARVLGLSVRGIEYAIGTLKKAKRIKKVGGKRFGHWEIGE